MELLEEKLRLDFGRELALNGYFDVAKNSLVIDLFEEAAFCLLQFKPSVISVELTPSDSIYFVAKIREFTVYYDAFFKKGNGELTLVAATVFKDGDFCFSVNGGTLKVYRALAKGLRDSCNEIGSGLNLKELELKFDAMLAKETKWSMWFWLFKYRLKTSVNKFIKIFK